MQISAYVADPPWVVQNNLMLFYQIPCCKLAKQPELNDMTAGKGRTSVINQGY